MEFDFIIVGGGSAGCVLANKLSADRQNKVLLLEAGPESKSLKLRIPAAVLSNLNSTKFNWAFQGEPEKHLMGRRIQHDRGKTLGGSSSINGMVFIRGHAMDFDGWQQAGCIGWGYENVLPYFKRMENYSAGGDTFRGSAGPLYVQRPNPDNPLVKAFIYAGQQAGYPVTDDINGYRQEGFGLLDSSVYQGERWSTVRAYLDPIRNRSNLKIITGAHVHKLKFIGRLVSGVIYEDQARRIHKVNARKETILSAGAICSPQVLMLSGIGPSQHLEEFGINVIANLQGVGQNLNEHPDFVIKYRCKKPVTLWPKTRPLAKAIAGIQWLFSKSGICASNQFEVVACLRSSAGVEYPDIQLTLTPIAVDDKTWSTLPEHAFQIHIGLMRARSRGRVELRSSDPMAPPKIFVNYLSDPWDRDTMHKGVKLAREIVDQPAMSEFAGDEIFPGRGIKNSDEIDECLNSHVTTQWHLSGTARMGSENDKSAVVDPVGRVHGIGGLRVIDASIMPTVTNGNINSPTIMIAERLSDEILGQPPLPKIEANVWKNNDYEIAQR